MRTPPLAATLTLSISLICAPATDNVCWQPNYSTWKDRTSMLMHGHNLFGHLDCSSTSSSTTIAQNNEEVGYLAIAHENKEYQVFPALGLVLT